MSPSARFAGVPAPAAKPTFRTERFGLWESNDSTKDPLITAEQADGAPVRHFSTNGNAFWTLDLGGQDATAMSWDKEDYFGLKFYFRMRAVDGRIQVWRKGGAGRGGPFLEIVDGKLRFGWWDTAQKREVYVETSAPVIYPGFVYYLYLRKRWPPRNTTGGNWEDSYWSNNQMRRLVMALPLTPGDGSVVTDGTRSGRVMRQVNETTFDVYTTTNDTAWAGTISGTAISSVVVPSSDLFILKRFQILETGSSATEKTGWQAYVDASATDRNVIGFTSSAAVRVAGVSAVGVVSPVGPLFTGAAAGVVDVADMDPSGATESFLLRNEMNFMYFTFGSDAPVEFAGKVYRATLVSPAGGGGGLGQFVCRDPYNLSTTPDFSSIVTPVKGQFSTGVELVKSDGFDDSKAPDNTGTTIYFMGSPDQGFATSTYQPFDGEVWCPGWMVDAPASAGVDARCFENVSAVTNDPTTIGTDYFQEQPYGTRNAALAHQLQYTTGYVRFAWDGRLYAGADIAASTQPLKVTTSASNRIGPAIAVSTLSPPITGTSRPYWTYVQPPGVWAEERYLAVGFYDPVQGVAGRPGPAARIKAIQDDDVNPTGVVRLILSGLPVGPPGTDVVVYQSTGNGNSSTLFECARVPSGTFEVAVQVLDSLLIVNQAADLTAFEPPRCFLVASSKSRVVYGALESQPDGLVASRVAQPGIADFPNAFRLSSGGGDRITAMAELDGLLAVFKRRAMGSVSFTAEGFAIVDLVSSGVGCVASQTLLAKDSILWFLSDRGVQTSQRTGVTNLGLPRYVGEPVERFFEAGVDHRRLSRSSAAINRQRNQYVVSLRGEDALRADLRLSVEMRTQTLAYSRYQGPNVSALATVQAKEPGTDVVIAGTEDGFVVWMDRSDTTLLMMGPSPIVWGAPDLQSYGGTSLVGVNLQNSQLTDQTPGGVLGVAMRFADSAGVEREVQLLAADGPYLHFAEVAVAAVPDTVRMFLGAQRVHWETPWLDMGNFERMKSLLYVDLVLDTSDTEPSGQIRCRLYRDWDLDPKLFTKTLDLGVVPYRLTPTSLRGRWFKLVIEHTPDSSDVRFDIAALVWRVRDEDQV